ncbi:hypothetical protein [Acinetobacter bouvetii]|nr:hypothetical protein [Acinetobacter bouvetii]
MPFLFQSLIQANFGYTQCGKDATRYPSLHCILKQCLKLAQDVVYG